MNTRRGLNALLCQQLHDLLDGESRVGEFLAKLRDSPLAHDLRALVDEARANAEAAGLELRGHCEVLPSHRTANSEIMRGIVHAGERSAEEWEVSATRDAAVLVFLRHVLSFQFMNYRINREFADCLSRHDLVACLKRLEGRATRLHRRLSHLAVGGWFSVGLGSEAAGEEASGGGEA